jgi:hypothetical protein
LKGAVVREATSAVGITPPHTHTHTHRKNNISQHCRSVCGALAEIGFERKMTNARVHVMSTWPNTDVLWCEHWHRWTDRRARRVDAPRQTPVAAARPATPNPNPSAEWAQRRTRTASRCTCACVHYVPVPPRCARHSTACACALCGRNLLYPSIRGCNSARRGAARAPVTVRVLHGLSPPSPLDRRAPTARTDGRSSVGRDGARGWGGGGAVRRRAECTSLFPALYAASFP